MRLLGLELDESLVWKARRRRCCCCVGRAGIDPLEVAFEFTNLSAVSIHRVFDAIPLFVDLLDDDLGIAES
jgi:hypothetical protein